MLPVTALLATQSRRVSSSPSSVSSSVIRSPNVRMSWSFAGLTLRMGDRSLVAGRDRVAAQPGGDLGDQHRVLRALVFGIGEHERQQLIGAKLRQRPVERAHGLVAGSDVRGTRRIDLSRRGENPYISERLRWKSQLVVQGPLIGVQPVIGVVQEQ